ncbi:hypothetical protein NBRC116585_12620 [Thalassolituus maritimus]|uniref:Uncharacterized protein n=1 Tax=Thalassolituus maritimus TaxID=484498 RepID=A0ABP9ZYG2_9GAMM
MFFDTEDLIFKTDFDDYFGVYCNDVFTGIVIHDELFGLIVTEDLSSCSGQVSKPLVDL